MLAKIEISSKSTIFEAITENKRFQKLDSFAS